MMLEQRQPFRNDNGTTTFVDGDGNVETTGHGNFWYSTKAEIIKWAVVAGIVFIVLVWFVGGRYHAKRRVKKGMKPLRYHRFLLPRSQRAKFEPQNNFSFYRQDDQGYRMDAYVPPPPVYNPNLAAPPGYGVPQGASKASSSQEWITPPAGPPPGRSATPDVDQQWIAPPAGAPPGRAATPDVEQGMASGTTHVAPAKNGLLQKFKPKLPKLNPFGR